MQESYKCNLPRLARGNEQCLWGIHIAIGDSLYRINNRAEFGCRRNQLGLRLWLLRRLLQRWWAFQVVKSQKITCKWAWYYAELRFFDQFGTVACACLDTSGVASLRQTSTRLKTKRPAQTKRNIGKERAAALDRLPTRPLFLLPMKSCVVKTFVLNLFLFWFLVSFTKLFCCVGACLPDKTSVILRI